MTPYTDMTRDRLAAAYNEAAGTDLKPTSYPKRTWIEMLESMETDVDPAPTDETTPTATETTKKEVIIELAMDATRSWKEIADVVRDSMGGDTSDKSVASVVCKARKAGVPIPTRQTRVARARVSDFHALAADRVPEDAR